jgi:hypothetical protein
MNRPLPELQHVPESLAVELPVRVNRRYANPNGTGVGANGTDGAGVLAFSCGLSSSILPTGRNVNGGTGAGSDIAGNMPVQHLNPVGALKFRRNIL